MLKFSINPYYTTKADLYDQVEIKAGVESATHTIQAYHQDKAEFEKVTALIGEGNDAGGKVYSLVGTKFCLKICPLGKHVGPNQELQFTLNDQCLEAISGKRVKIEGTYYNLTCSPVIAVAVEDGYAYTLMIRLDGTIRMWDEARTPFVDKDHFDITKKVRKMMHEYGGDDFVKAMDINGNNLMIDFRQKLMYVIDPYVPADA